jgi:mono/diheme cytochrome c family protein
MTQLRLAIIAGVCVSSLLSLACQPWGKPKPLPPPAEDITDFQTLYNSNCSACHGINGKNGPARPLNDPLFLALIPRDTLQQTIENGLPGTSMPAWARSQGGPLYPKQVTALVNAIEKNWAKPVNLKGAALPAYATATAGDAARGKKLFVRDCFMCHGQGAAIGPVTDPAYLTLVTDQVLRSTIITGRPDLGMPDFRALNLGHALADQDVTDLVAYLGSLRPAAAANSENANAGNDQRGGK